MFYETESAAELRKIYKTEITKKQLKFVIVTFDYYLGCYAFLGDFKLTDL